MKTKCLMYCTKALPNLYKLDENEFYTDRDTHYNGLALNGKIIAECEVETEKIECRFEDDDFGGDYVYSLEKSEDVDFGVESCLDYDALDSYLKSNNGYALHILNLKIFDKPLSFDKDYIYKDYKTNSVLTKAPQNMCSVYDRFGNKYILISIQPQHLVNILNGEKTIEIRRKVLNCMKEGE